MAPVRERLGWRTAGQAPDWGYPALVAAGTLLVTGAIAFAGAGNVVYPMFYLWISLSAFYVFPARIAHAQLALVGVGYALTGVSADRWLIVVGTVWLAGALTGLLNHRGFDERLETMLAQSNRSGREFTLAIGDLDGFTSVNDRLGHLAGDDVLRRLAPLLRDALRAGDSVGRLGGDEFALLVDGVTALPTHRTDAIHETCAGSPRSKLVVLAAVIVVAVLTMWPRGARRARRRAEALGLA
jgi:diguanylate cyclase (GGDEF)-like protein